MVDATKDGIRKEKIFKQYVMEITCNLHFVMELKKNSALDI